MNEDERVSEITRTVEELKAGRMNWLQTWRDVTNYVVPRRGDWEIDNTTGKKPEVKVYDIEAISAHNLFVDGFQGYLVSQATKWFKMGLEDEEQEKMPGVPVYLGLVEKVLYNTFARSNFYEAMNEFISDGVSLATAAMFVEDDISAGKPHYSARHLKEVYIAEGKSGIVDSVYRDYNVTNRQALQTWGKALTTERIERCRKNPFANCRIIHAVRPRSEYDPERADAGNKPWESIYIDKDEKKTIEEGGYDMFPYLVWRFRKNSDEIYGRSPAIDAMPLILRLNQIARTQLQAAQLAVEPPLNVPAAMKGSERIVPRGLNYYTNPQEVITPINLAGNYPISKDQEIEMREQIREIFRTKIFMLMEQLTKGPYTATEIRERQGEKAAVLGATIGRFNSEVLVPLIQRTYAICEKNRQMPEAPQSLMGARFQITFSGPLAQAQRKYHDSQGVAQAIQILTAIMPIKQEALDNINFDEFTRIAMDSASLRSVLYEVAEIEETRKIRAEAIAQAQAKAEQQETQKTIASNAAKLNQPMQPGSMLQGIGQAVAQQQKRGKA